MIYQEHTPEEQLSWARKNWYTAIKNLQKAQAHGVTAQNNISVAASYVCEGYKLVTEAKAEIERRG